MDRLISPRQPLLERFSIAAVIGVVLWACGGDLTDSGSDTHLASSGTAHARWYVAPTATSGGTGTSSSPWGLAYALSGGGGKIQPGDTIWLRGGTYNAGPLNATVRGTAGSPVIVRQYPGERALVYGTFSVSGSDVWYWGFEQATNRLSQDRTGFDVHAARVKLINLIIRDNSGNGVGNWVDAPDAEVVGCVIYNNGYWGSSGGWPSPGSWGHGMYVQNRAPATKLLRNNIVFQQFGYGFHLYSQGDHIDNVTVQGNVAFRNGLKNGVDLINHSGSYPTTNLMVKGNWFYGNPIVWLYGDPGVTSTVDGNRIIGGACLRFLDWTAGKLTVRNNICQASGLSFAFAVDASNVSSSKMSWTSNRWYGNSSAAAWRWNGALYTFTQWKSQTGLGGSDSYAGSSAPAAALVEANPYERGAGLIVIYNPSSAGSVSVDIASIVPAGQPFSIRNVYNLSGSPLVSGTYRGGTVSVPMTVMAPPKPYNGGLGWNGITPPQVLPKFGAFRVTAR